MTHRIQNTSLRKLHSNTKISYPKRNHPNPSSKTRPLVHICCSTHQYYWTKGNHTHTITCSKYYEINYMEIRGSTLQLSRALGLQLLVKLVSVTWALMFVTISPRRDAVAFLAADPTVLEASVLHSSLRAPCLALPVTKRCSTQNPQSQNPPS